MQPTLSSRDAIVSGDVSRRDEDAELRESHRVWAVRLGWVTVGVGGLILAGWILDVPILRSLLPRQVEAKANTAMCFLLAGLALVLRSGPAQASGPVRSWFGRGCAALAALGGLLTLAEYASGHSLGLDEWLFRDQVGAAYTVHPGRMALPTALNFFLLGLALLIMRTDRDRPAVPWLVTPATGLASLAFIGQLYDLPQLASFGPFTPIAAPTGVAFVILGVGVSLAGSHGLVLWLHRSNRAIGFTAAVLLLVVMAGAVVRHTHAMVRNGQQVEHTHDVLQKLAATLSALQDVETGSRGYLLTGDRQFLDPYLTASTAIEALLRTLRVLMADNPGQQVRLGGLEELVGRKLAAAKKQIGLRAQNAGVAEDLDAAVEGKRLMDGVRAVVAVMQDEEERLLRERQARMAASTLRTLLTLGSGLLVSVGLLLTTFNLLRREILAHRRTELALRDSEVDLAVTLNSIGDGVLATDTRGHITRMNRMAEQLTGWARAEAHGRPVAEVFRIIHEQTRAPAPIPVATVLATGEIRDLANHTVLLARDGTERAIADSAAPIRDQAGKILGVVMVFRDVTESRRARAELDRFFELSLDFLCISGSDGFFKRASPGITEILGWTVEEFLSRPYLEQIHPDDVPATRQAVERQVALGQKVLNFENRYRHKDGSWRVLSWRSAPYGTLMYATARDVTETRRAEEDIRRLNTALAERAAQLEAANRELESFSHSVSHDLRAPLRHVQGYIAMLTREVQGGLSEKAQRYLRTIADAAREMGVLIDDLLAFSRMGRAEMSETEFELAALVAEVRDSLQGEAAGRDIRWTIGPLPRVRGDAAMLRQVLVNLLGNAVKYTRRRAPATIEVGRSGREEGREVFYIRDNGAGFDMQYADKLFGVFQRLHRADEFEGTGIGLANVRRIIARHGGRTWAESRPDAGATFYFTLAPADASATPAST